MALGRWSEVHGCSVVPGNRRSSSTGRGGGPPTPAKLLNTSSGRRVGSLECTSRCRVEPRAMTTRQRCSPLRWNSSGTAARLPFCRCVTWRLAYRAARFQTSFELPKRGVLGRNKGEGAARFCDSVAIAFDRQPRCGDRVRARGLEPPPPKGPGPKPGASADFATPAYTNVDREGSPGLAHARQRCRAAPCGHRIPTKRSLSGVATPLRSR
jgi:hypothetical protein